MLRPDVPDGSTTTVTTVAPLPLSGDLDTTAASTTPAATFSLGDGGLLNGDSVTTWPSGRYTESIQSRMDSGGAVIGNVSEVPIPATALLAMIGLAIVGAGRARFTPQE